MPSPVGHALAGLAIAWTGDAVAGLKSRGATPPPAERPDWTSSIVCVALAAAPDLDLLAPYQHRTATHSVVVLAAATIIAIVVTGKVKPPARRLILFGAAAWASHLLLDWLAEDTSIPRGIQLLWPLSRDWFISGLDIFRGTARREVFSALSMRTNALAIAQEIAILGPIVVAAWLVRVKALARLAPQLTRGHHAAQ